MITIGILNFFLGIIGIFGYRADIGNNWKFIIRQLRQTGKISVDDLPLPVTFAKLSNALGNAPIPCQPYKPSLFQSHLFLKSHSLTQKHTARTNAPAPALGGVPRLQMPLQITRAADLPESGELMPDDATCHGTSFFIASLQAPDRWLH